MNALIRTYLCKNITRNIIENKMGGKKTFCLTYKSKISLVRNID